MALGQTEGSRDHEPWEEDLHEVFIFLNCIRGSKVPRLPQTQKCLQTLWSMSLNCSLQESTPQPGWVDNQSLGSSVETLLSQETNFPSQPRTWNSFPRSFLASTRSEGGTRLKQVFSCATVVLRTQGSAK